MDATAGADEFCAASDWAFAAACSFADTGPPALVVADGAGAGLRSVVAADGRRVLLGLDPVWGFATPVVGPPPAAVACVVELLAGVSWDAVALTGQARGLPLTEALIGALSEHRLGLGREEGRVRADLSDGFEGWLARRSPRFRRRLRQLETAATEAGLTVEDAGGGDPDALLDRLVAAERTSWKGREGSGLVSAEMAGFYRRVLRRLAPTGRHRALVARLDGADVGFALGGVRGATYRGLQLSASTAVSHLGVGHLLQLHQLRALDPSTTTYDLGMVMAYKHRWGDRVDVTRTLVVHRC